MSGDALSLLLIGGGGHARVVIDAAGRCGIKIEGLLDKTRPAGEVLDAVAVLGGDERLETPAAAGYRYHIAIATPDVRYRLRTLVEGKRLPIATIIHPAAIVSAQTEIAAGCFLAAGAIVNPGSRLDTGVIVNTGAQIDHDVEVGADCHIGPGAVLCGGVRCRAGVFVGAGATIIPGVTIGDGATIAAGATVVDDVAEGVTVAGTPAKPIGKR